MSQYSVVHKTILSGTEVHATGKRPYKRAKYETLCNKPVSRFAHDELARLGGRRESNRDVMAASAEIEKFNRESEMESWNR